MLRTGHVRSDVDQVMASRDGEISYSGGERGLLLTVHWSAANVSATEHMFLVVCDVHVPTALGGFTYIYIVFRSVWLCGVVRINGVSKHTPYTWAEEKKNEYSNKSRRNDWLLFKCTRSITAQNHHWNFVFRSTNEFVSWPKFQFSMEQVATCFLILPDTSRVTKPSCKTLQGVVITLKRIWIPLSQDILQLESLLSGGTPQARKKK